jgi:hypothetical protein
MLDREKVINELKLCLDGSNGCVGCQHIKHVACKHYLMADALALLKEQEAVVRCKDCKYGEPWGVLIGCGTSKGFGITHKPDWYCADGERKE